MKVKSYEPSVFSQIRAVSGVTDEEFRDEWNPDTVANNVAAKGAGKSGALFVASKTRRFLLKTLRKDEKDALRAMSHGLLKVRVNPRSDPLAPFDGLLTSDSSAL